MKVISALRVRLIQLPGQQEIPACLTGAWPHPAAEKFYGDGQLVCISPLGGKRRINDAKGHLHICLQIPLAAATMLEILTGRGKKGLVIVHIH